MSATQMLVVEQLVRTVLLLDVVDAAIFSAPFDPRDADSRKLLMDAQRMRYTVSQLAGQLGMTAAPKPVLSPRQILELEGDGEGTYGTGDGAQSGGE